MGDWEEVRKLAADFQKLQASTGAHRLSERNCIEVVSRLVAMGMLEVVYTLDGKEYVTPQHLEREIRNELLLNRGTYTCTYSIKTHDGIFRKVIVCHSMCKGSF